MDITQPDASQITGIGAAISLISAAVITACQLSKRLLPGDGWGPYLGLVWSIVGVLVWLYSQPVWPPARESAFAIMSATIIVWGFASGIYAVSKLSGEQVEGLRGRRRKQPPREEEPRSLANREVPPVVGGEIRHDPPSPPPAPEAPAPIRAPVYR